MFLENFRITRVLLTLYIKRNIYIYKNNLKIRKNTFLCKRRGLTSPYFYRLKSSDPPVAATHALTFFLTKIEPIETHTEPF